MSTVASRGVASSGGASCFAWGAGTQGQLGAAGLRDALVPTHVQLPPGDNAVSAVWCGANHAVCITAHGGAFVWGLCDLHQQQAEGEAQQAAASQPGARACATPQPLALPAAAVRVRRVAAGWAHTLLLSEAGALYVAGDNGFGQLGLGQQLASSAALLPLPLLQQQSKPGTAAQLAAAATHSCVADVAAGMRHSIVLLQHEAAEQQQQQQQGGSCVLGWGSNKWQQLGTDDGSSSGPAWWRPRQLRGMLPAGTVVARLAAGGDRSAAITAGDGRLLLWGRPLPGPCVGSACDGGATCWPQPARQADWLCGSGDGGGTLRWRGVCLGWRHAAALDEAGQVWAAGDDSLCQLGQQQQQQQQQQQGAGQQQQQQQQQQQAPPWLVRLPAPAACLAAGAEHTAAVLHGGGVVTWGWGEHGQLGTGGTADAAAPQRVPLGGGWRASGVACGAGFTVAWGSSSGSSNAV